MRDKEYLENQLRDQISFIESSCLLYDQGKEHEAKRIATNIRTLIKDKGSSASVLGQLEVKLSMKYLNSVPPMNLQSVTTQEGFISRRVQGNQISYQPVLGDFLQLIGKKELTYERWISQIVYLGENGEGEWTRLNFLEWLAEKEGGAHSDKKPDPRYKMLIETSESLWFMEKYNPMKDTFDKIKIENNLVYAGMRQIGFEILESLKTYEFQIS